MIAGFEALDESLTANDIAERLGITPRTAREWIQRWREAGHVEPTNPTARRVHSIRLASAWRAILGQ